MRRSLRLLPLLLLIGSISLHAAIPATERSALIAIYNSMDGAHWVHSENWNGAPGTECTWAAVTCDANQTTVEKLDLSWNNATGAIPSALTGLPNLKLLSFTSCNVSGGIPLFLTQLTHLETLSLNEFYGTPLGGTIPKELANIVTLKELDLSGNNLSGTIPTELTTLPNLEKLNLSINRLTGSIPAAFFQSTKIQVLTLGYNKLTGSISSNFSMPALTSIDLSSNTLSGNIPNGIGGSPNLAYINFYADGLTGPLPTSIGALTKLEEIGVAANELSGPIPHELGNCTLLRYLSLGGNPFTGTIPPELGQLNKLTYLYLGNTHISGAIPAQLFHLASIKELYLSHNFYDSSNTAFFTGNLADFAQLTTLEALDLSTNDFPGPIPVALTTLPNLKSLDLSRNLLGGPLPSELGNMSKLESLAVESAALTGPIPDSISGLANLSYFSVSNNRLTSLPVNLARMSSLKLIRVSSNLLEGSLPGELGSLPKIEYILLDNNKFSGAIPPELFNAPSTLNVSLNVNALTGTIPSMAKMTNLRKLDVSANRLTGALPADAGASTELDEFYANDNILTGAIPDSLSHRSTLDRLNLASNGFSGTLPDFSATTLNSLELSRNHFEGPIPASIGSLTALTFLDLYANKLSGQIPSQITNLTSMVDGYLGLGKNALYNHNSAISAYLTQKAGSWDQTQTITPENFAVSAVHANSIVLSWTPVNYVYDSGGYSIYASTSPNGPFDLLVTTPDKSIATFTIDGLTPSTDYYVKVSTVTFVTSDNPNNVFSESSPILHAKTSTGAPAPAAVVVLTSPDGLYQIIGQAAASARYVLTNVGDLPTTITLTQDGDFFTQSPATFTLNGGASQAVVLTGVAKPDGVYSGFSIPSGTGVPSSLKIPVRLLSTTPPVGTVNAVPSTTRIDISASIDVDSVNGSVNFTNTGNAALVGIAVADVPWILTPTNRIVIDPGTTVTVNFGVQRTRRNTAPEVGAAVGTLSLVYANGTGSARGSAATAPPATAIVTVIDTITPKTTTSGFDPIPNGVVPLFLPGVGHLQGSVGLFLSDLSIINAFGTGTLNDVTIYYTPAAGFPLSTSVATVTGITPAQSIALADVVNGTFSNQQQGTLQIRTPSWKSLSLSASIFNVTNPRGTYGSSIPLFRGDRAVRPGASLYLVGVRKRAGFHTNILLQETAGQSADVDLTFYDESGNVVTPGGGNVSANGPPFQLARLLDSVPANAVTAKVTNRAGSAGNIVAYATPIDEASGDFWTVADWNQIFATSQSDVQIIPVAGSVHGANNNFFRTDIALSNRTAASNKLHLAFYYNNGSAVLSQDVTLTANETRAIDDVVGTLFPSLTNQVGYIVVTPAAAATVTSRTFATQEGITGTFGTGVPSVAPGSALHVGQSKLIAGLQVASLATIGEKKPATFRTNLGLAEINGQAATVRVNVVYSELHSSVLASRLLSKTIQLAPHQFSLLSVSSMIAESNPNVDDLRDVRLDITVTGGDGAVIAFTASTDNGTADQILRTE